jgi:hypothetical protein
MIVFYKFLASYEVLIYILLAIGAMFAFRWLWRSWREWQTAVYSLERQFSSRRMGRLLSPGFRQMFFLQRQRWI